jgi:hypothetical protein
MPERLWGRIVVRHILANVLLADAEVKFCAASWRFAAQFLLQSLKANTWAVLEFQSGPKISIGMNSDVELAWFAGRVKHLKVVDPRIQGHLESGVLNIHAATFLPPMRADLRAKPDDRVGSPIALLPIFGNGTTLAVSL